MQKEKKRNEKQKKTQTQNPPGGMVNRLERAYSKRYIFLLEAIYNIKKLKLMHFGPYYLGSKGLQQACNKLELNKMVVEASGKVWYVQELEIWQSFLLFFVGPAKK